MVVMLNFQVKNTYILQKLKTIHEGCAFFRLVLFLWPTRRVLLPNCEESCDCVYADAEPQTRGNVQAGVLFDSILFATGWVVLGCMHMNKIPQNKALHKFLQRGFFPCVAVLQELFCHGLFSQAGVHQQRSAPAWIPC